MILVAPGTELVEGGVYRARGSLRRRDPSSRVLRDAGHPPPAPRRQAVQVGRRGGLWVRTPRISPARLGAAPAPSPARALVAGIALGDTGGVPYSERESLRASGLYHVVAVSGQNVALLIAFTLVALGVAGVIGVPARLAAGAVTGAYVLVSGAGPSIVRAGVAGVLVSAAWLASRPAPAWHLMACGAAVVLGFDPLELFDPGFQLSFAAVAAILLVAPRLRGAVGEAAAVSIACTVVTAPIAWWHFGRLTPLAVPANLLALPAVAPILWLATIAAAVGSAWAPLAAPFLGLADLLVAYVALGCAEHAPSAPATPAHRTRRPGRARRDDLFAADVRQADHRTVPHRALGARGGSGISSAERLAAVDDDRDGRPSATRTTTICAGAGLAVASACAASSAVVACPSMVTTPVPVACPGRRRTSLSSTIRSTASRGRAYAPSPERQTNTLARPRASAGTDGRSPPEASTLRSSPHARTSRSSVAMLGDCCPRSIRATIAWDVPARRASSRCVSPA